MLVGTLLCLGEKKKPNSFEHLVSMRCIVDVVMEFSDLGARHVRSLVVAGRSLPVEEEGPSSPPSSSRVRASALRRQLALRGCYVDVVVAGLQASRKTLQ